jgi:hypothetical protein
VSTDGKEDTFSITIPQKVTLHSINYVAFKQNDGTETSIAYKTQDNTIDFAVNKTGAEYATDIDIKTNMTLSAPEQTP